jgi:hypothetical protein
MQDMVRISSFVPLRLCGDPKYHNIMEELPQRHKDTKKMNRYSYFLLAPMLSVRSLQSS